MNTECVWTWSRACKVISFSNFHTMWFSTVLQWKYSAESCQLSHVHIVTNADIADSEHVTRHTMMYICIQTPHEHRPAYKGGGVKITDGRSVKFWNGTHRRNQWQGTRSRTHEQYCDCRISQRRPPDATTVPILCAGSERWAVSPAHIGERVWRCVHLRKI